MITWISTTLALDIDMIESVVQKNAGSFGSTHVRYKNGQVFSITNQEAQWLREKMNCSEREKQIKIIQPYLDEITLLKHKIRVLNKKKKELKIVKKSKEPKQSSKVVNISTSSN